MKTTKKTAVFILLSACLICVLCCTACTEGENGKIRYISGTAEPTQLALVMNPVEKETPAPTAATSPTPAATPEPTPTPRPTPAPTSQIEHTIASMTVEEKIGQLVMFGFSGTESVSSEFKNILRKYKIGNVILYGPNIDKDQSDGGFSRCRKLTDSLRSYCAVDIPLLIAIDVEGGDVIRFNWDRSLYSASSLGKKNDTLLAERQFERIGEGLSAAGIDLDLAPVMDIAKDPDSTFLKNRIISSSAHVASEIGAACIRGLHNSGCLSLVKHFPGHGATSSDSHKTTPVVKKTLEQLEEYELIPFAAAVDAGTDGIMVGHLKYPNIDPDHIASQSAFFISDLLRKEMGFEGIVMSDDFRMDGLRKENPLRKAAVNFILAGGDIILCGPNHTFQKEILEGLYEAYDTGVLTEERIDESLMRILTAKEKIG